MERITSIAEGAPAVGPYSLATTVERPGKVIETAGQIALTPEGGFVEDTIQNETHQVMRNLQAILGEAGCTFSDVTFAFIYYTKRGSFGAINEAYAQYFPDQQYPARATVGVAFLPDERARVEIAMRAFVKNK